MSIDKSSYLDYTTILSKHKQNEILYKQKIKQLNYTRTKISDQFQLLQQTYDKKLKTLQNKLESLKNQNQQLIKQNLIYKVDIENYQSRLIEKQKIIGVLLGQKKDVISSDRSKSEKTESLNAHEEQNGKFNKKQSITKDKYQIQNISTNKIAAPSVQKLLEESKINPSFLKQMNKDVNESNIRKIQTNTVQVKNANNFIHEQSIEHNDENKIKQKQKSLTKNSNVLIKEQYPNHAVAERLTLTQKKQRQQNNSHSQDQQVSSKSNLPSKPKSNKNKSPPPPMPPKKKKKPTQYRQFYEGQDQQQIYQMGQNAHIVQLTHQKTLENNSISIQNYTEHHNEIANNLKVETQIQQRQYQHKLNNYHNKISYVQPQSKPQPNFLHHFHNQQKQQNNFLSRFSNQNNNQYQVEQIKSAQNNLLSHFTSNIDQITSQPYSVTKFSRNKKKKKINEGQESQNISKNINKSQIISQKNDKDIKKDKRNDSSSIIKSYLSRQHLEDGQNTQNNNSLPIKSKFQDVGNANEFFNNFNQNFHEQNHHLQIMQSSIDHIERDCSIISNQQPYFTDANATPKQKTVKMPKKKGKRDQIKQMDPSLFE